MTSTWIATHGARNPSAIRLVARIRRSDDGDAPTHTAIRSRVGHVVSMPCSELFDRQPREYRDSVLPPAVTARVAVEQASALGWHRYVGDGGAIVAMHTFGASAPLKQLVEKFGFTPDAVAQVAREVVSK